MNNEIINIVLDFLKEAGEIALKYQDNLSATAKQDKSIVTEADLTISKLFNERIKIFLDTKQHKILDEENLPKKEDFFNNDCEYLWTIDPIDGTTTYFYGFNLWAIGISLYKNYEPYMGFIYLPSINELVYTNSEKSYYIKNAFKNDEIKEELKLKDIELMPKSIILQHRLKNYDINKFVILDLYSSYILGFYTLIGKGVASFFNTPMKLWDITAILPIAKNIGMSFKNINNNFNINSLKDIETDDQWHLNNTYIMSNENLCEKIKKELFF